MKYHFRISNTRTSGAAVLWTLSSPEKYEELQQLSGNKTGYNTVQLFERMMHHIPISINPLICSNTGYSPITHSMNAYSPLSTTVSVHIGAAFITCFRIERRTDMRNGSRLMGGKWKGAERRKSFPMQNV